MACDDHEVAAFAESLGASVIWTPGLGLSGAVEAGVEHLRAAGVTIVVVSHADLPYAEDFAHIGEEGTVTIVPDRHRDGTNVIGVPAGAGFCFSYGPGSFERHCAEAARVGLPVIVVEDERLAADVDLPADLALLAIARSNFGLAAKAFSPARCRQRLLAELPARTCRARGARNAPCGHGRRDT